MSARELASFFRGRRQVAVATVTANGEPRVSPVDALLIHGRFWFGTHKSAARIRHLRARPGVSLAYFERDELAIVVHGVAELVEFRDPAFEAVDADFLAVYGGSPSTEAEGSVFVCVHPRAIHTFVQRRADASG
jgi:hypothetical protein